MVEEGMENELWNELLDIVSELRDDAKSNRRMRRHVRSLEVAINELGNTLTKMTSGKKRLF